MRCRAMASVGPGADLELASSCNRRSSWLAPESHQIPVARGAGPVINSAAAGCCARSLEVTLPESTVEVDHVTRLRRPFLTTTISSPASPTAAVVPESVQASRKAQGQRKTMTTEYESTVLFDDMSRRPGESFDLLAQSGTSLYLGGTSTTLLNVTLGDAQISGSAAPLREGAKRMASVGEASSFMPTDWSKRDGESFDLMGQSGTDFLAGLTGGDSMASFGGHLVFGADEDRLQQLESAGAEGDRLIDVPAPTPRPASKVLAPVHPATRAPPLSSDGADDSLMDFATPAPRRLLSSLATPAQRLTRHEAMEQLSLMDPTPAMSNRTLPVVSHTSLLSLSIY